MLRIFISFIIIFFHIYYNRVASNISEFPISLIEVRQYINNIESIIKEKSCISSKIDHSIIENNLKISLIQIQLAIKKLDKTKSIFQHLTKNSENEIRHHSKRVFNYIDDLYDDFKINILNLTYYNINDHDFHLNIIHIRNANRKLISESMRMQFIQCDDQPNSNVFSEAVTIHNIMDNTLWCGANDFSLKQSLFTFYYAILISEIQIFLMDLSDYIISTCYIKTPTILIDWNDKKLQLLFKIGQYIQSLKKAIANSRKNIYQCPPSELIQGETYLEFINTSISGGTTVEVCQASTTEVSSQNWINDFQNQYKSNDKSCPNKVSLVIQLDKSNSFILPQYTTKMCILTCAPSNTTSDALRTISFMEQLSDIKNNMIVTNVKFVSDNDMIQIQIEQGQLIKSSKFEIRDSPIWKPLNNFKKTYDTKTKRIVFYIEGKIPAEAKPLNENIHYVHINSKHKTLHLDDVILPLGYVVTGVRFGHSEKLTENLKAFELQVHATKYNADTNELITVENGKSTSFWFMPNMLNSLVIPGYKRERLKYGVNIGSKVQLNELNWKLPDSEPNHYVKFSRSEFLIRNEERTIPFFDGRPTFSKIPLPLSGIGIFLKAFQNRETYITLETFSFPISQIIIL